MRSLYSLARLFALTMVIGTFVFGLSASATQARPGAVPQAAGNATIGLVGPSAPVDQGTIFSVALDATALGDPLAAFQVDVVFDPTVLTFNGITPGSHLESSGRTAVCPPAAISSGRVRFACASAGEASGVTNPGQLATLSFTARDAGSSDLSLEGVQLVDSERPPTLFSVNSQGASVTVASSVPEATATPTATPEPTATATATPRPTATPTPNAPADSFEIYLPAVESNQPAREFSESDQEIFLPNIESR